MSLMCLCTNSDVIYLVPVDSEDFCLAETFSANCQSNDVIVIDEALFGRMELGRCVTRNFGNVGCSENVIGQLDRKCSGRSHCHVSASDPTLVRTSPCPKDFSTYLRATYSCVHGNTCCFSI